MRRNVEQDLFVFGVQTYQLRRACCYLYADSLGFHGLTSNIGKTGTIAVGYDYSKWTLRLLFNESGHTGSYLHEQAKSFSERITLKL